MSIRLRFNERELISHANESSDKEGRLKVKVPGFREVFKERWFKLKGNLLYYYRLNEYGAVYEKEPAGLYVLENLRIHKEEYFELPNTFSLDDGDKKHYFSSSSARKCGLWVECLKNASYEQKRLKLQSLEDEIKKVRSRSFI
ncbi:PLEKHJ1 (predicted) [Pycnogonum litorale]